MGEREEERKGGRRREEKRRREEGKEEEKIKRYIYLTIIFLYHLLNLSGCGIGYTSTHSLN